MSTKNLARTVIEGGRRWSNRWARRQSQGTERAALRVVLASSTGTVDFDAALYPQRPPVRRDFNDKLSPARRWLCSQVGRHWNKVRSELFDRFDSRTTAGRHILFCHLLRSVSIGRVRRLDYAEFVVDDHGILRLNEPRVPWRRARPAPLPEPADLLSRWIGDRRVGKRDDLLFWFVRTEAGFFRQEKKLTQAERERWEVLPRWFKDQYDPVLNPRAAEQRST